MKLLFKWLLLTLIVIFTAWLIPGISVSGYMSAIIAAALIALVNTFLKPIIKAITLPINVVTLGLFSIVINALLLMLVGSVVPGFIISGFGAACLGSILMSILSVILNLI